MRMQESRRNNGKNKLLSEKKRATTEQIFILRNIPFKKAFESVRRDKLWNVLRNYGIPNNFVNIIQGTVSYLVPKQASPILGEFLDVLPPQRIW